MSYSDLHITIYSVWESQDTNIFLFLNLHQFFAKKITFQRDYFYLFIYSILIPCCSLKN